MKKRLPVIIGVIVTALFAILYSYFTDVTHKIYDNNVNTASYTAIGVLLPGETIEQTFVSQEDVIDGFMIKCNTSGNYGDTAVIVRVYDAETKELLSETKESGSVIKARKLHKFKMNPISGCKGRELILQVEEEGTTEADGIILYFQPGEENADGLVIKDNQTAGVFIMKTVTDRFSVQTCLVLLISEWFIWAFLWGLYKLFQ